MRMGFPQVDKHLTDNGSLTVKNGDNDQLANLMVDLQQEIVSKDKLLREKDKTIASLTECEIAKDHELLDLRKRIESIQSNNNRNDETVSDFNFFLLEKYSSAFVSQIVSKS